MNRKTYEFPQSSFKKLKNEIKQYCEKQVTSEREQKKTEFLDDFQSIIWMTYRKDFNSIINTPTIPKEHHYQSDSGWGCMIRSSQMLCSNCILRHFFNEKPFSLKLLETDKEAKIKYLSIIWQ